MRKTHPGKPEPSTPERKPRIVDAAGFQNGREAVLEGHARKAREEIVRALTECNGRVGGADGALGINSTTLFSRVKKFGMDAKQFG